MGKRIKFLWILTLCNFLFVPGVCLGDETELFTSSAMPDALILLDLSGSMTWDPAGNSCSTPGCSKVEIAKNAVKTILDDNGDGTIDDRDEASLGIRIGYMRFTNCDTEDTDGSYSSGCNSLLNPIPIADTTPFSSPSRYSDIWTQVNAASGSGKTPLASALNEAKLYLDFHKNNDGAIDCRQKFVILISDGADTLACNGNGSETQFDMYKRRKATVAKAKALKDAGYRLFVIGFGANMVAAFRNTLNWAAFYGGTDNPSETNSGDTGSITPSADPCGEPDTNDPGTASLSGYAFLATNASELSAALRGTFMTISESRFSFTMSSVALSRVSSENFAYEASFKPKRSDPFWPGHLKKFSINSDGSLGGVLWNAGILLQSRDASTRQIFTYLSGAMTPFVSGSFSSVELADKYLNVPTVNDAQAVVGYIRGDSSYNLESWKLGDIFHSNPVAIGSPSGYYIDYRSPQAFVNFRNSYLSREKIVVVGSNDGQFHAFRGSDGSEKWSFIPPNLLSKLKSISHSTHPTKLQHLFFVDGPVTVADVWLGSGDGLSKNGSDWHTLLVFGEGKGVRDSKNSDAIYLWSSSPSCDFDFKREYDLTHTNYCGYYALDVTDTSVNQPVLMWRLNFPVGAPQTQQYLGEPWSRMAMGRVILNGHEKWVGFIGGGSFKDGDKGKGFFVVDLSNGAVLWSFTKGDNGQMDRIPASPAIVDTDNDGLIDTAYVGDLGGNMWRFKFCTRTDAATCNTGNWSGGLLFQASGEFKKPIYTTAAVARDQGYIWVFWGTGDPENPSVTDKTYHFFALKDSDRATAYAIGNFQDLSTTGTVFTGAQPGWYITLAGKGEKVLSNPAVFGGMVVFTTYTPATKKSDLCGATGMGNLYAMAMMPLAINGVTYAPGAGLLSGGSRSATIGTGIAKVPVFSQKPSPGGATDLYLSVSGAGSEETQIMSATILGSTPLTERLKSTSPSAQILHWWDMRVQ